MPDTTLTPDVFMNEAQAPSNQELTPDAFMSEGPQPPAKGSKPSDYTSFDTRTGAWRGPAVDPAPTPRAPMPIPPALQGPPDPVRPSAPNVPLMGVYGVPLPAPPPPLQIDPAKIAQGTVRNLKNLVGSTGPMVQNNPDLGGSLGAPPPTPDQLQQFHQATQTPVVPLSEGAQPGTVMHGVLSGAESLTTPQNAAVLAGMTATGGTLAGLAAGATGARLVALRSINLALSTYFTKEMAKGLTKDGLEAYQAWQKGDYDTVAEKLGQGSVEGLFTAFGLKHVWHSAGDVLRTQVRRPQGTPPPPPAPTGPYNREPQPIQAPEREIAAPAEGRDNSTPPPPPENPTNPTTENPPTPTPPESATSEAPDQALSEAEQKAAEREAKRQARTQAALEHARQNPAVTVPQLQTKFKLGAEAARHVLAQAQAERVPTPVPTPESGEPAPIGDVPAVPASEITPDTVMAEPPEAEPTKPTKLAEPAASATNPESVRLPGGNPAPQNSGAIAASEISGVLGGMGSGLTSGLYGMLFGKLQKGDTTELGKPSRVLLAAKPWFDAGQIRSAEDLQAFVKNGEKPLPEWTAPPANELNELNEVSPAPRAADPERELSPATEILHTIPNEQDGLQAEVARNTRTGQYSVVLRDTDAGQTSPQIRRFDDEGKALDYARTLVQQPKPAAPEPPASGETKYVLPSVVTAQYAGTPQPEAPAETRHARLSELATQLEPHATGQATDLAERQRLVKAALDLKLGQAEGGKLTPEEDAHFEAEIRPQLDGIIRNAGSAARKEGRQITPDTPLTEMSVAEFKRHRPDEALQSLPLKDEALQPENWTTEGLSARSKNELEGLATYHGLTTSGTKAELAKRLVEHRDLAKQYADRHPEDLAKELSGAQLEALVRQLGAPNYGNKLNKAQAIVNTFAQRKAKGETQLAEYNYHRLLNEGPPPPQEAPAEPTAPQETLAATQPEPAAQETPAAEALTPDSQLESTPARTWAPARTHFEALQHIQATAPAERKNAPAYFVSAWPHKYYSFDEGRELSKAEYLAQLAAHDALVLTEQSDGGALSTYTHAADYRREAHLSITPAPATPEAPAEVTPDSVMAEQPSGMDAVREALQQVAKALDQIEGVATRQTTEPSEEPPAAATIKEDERSAERTPADDQSGNERLGASHPEPLGEASPAVRAESEGEEPSASDGGTSGDPARGDVQRVEEQGPGARSGAGDRPAAVDQPGERSGGERSPAERSEKPGDLTGQTAGHDFRLAESDRIGEGTPRQKLTANLDAIRLVKQIQTENRLATRDEQAILARYVGWGGLWQIFDDYKREYSGAREELKSLLTPEEYKEAQASTKNAHYTSPLVISKMWEAMKHLGVKPGSSVLEPSMGIGSFFGLQPDDLLPARRTGVELDSITGQLARALYPDSNVQITGFQKLAFPQDFFDLAIGNVPFGDYGVADPKYRKNPLATHRIHNYFFVKSLDVVRPGGIVAFVTSRYTMDAQSAALRKLLASKANLVGMVRLPDTAFKGNAGTEVVTDLVILQKRAPGEAASGPNWINTKEVETRTGKTTLNEYYAENPHMILGELNTQGSMYSANQQNVSGQLTPELLDKAIQQLPKNIFSEWKAETPSFQGEDLVHLGDEVKDGGYSEKNGVLVQREGSVYRPVPMGQTQAARVKAMIPLRGAVREVYKTQIENASEKAIALARQNLNKVYDGFVKKFGPVSSAANSRAFGADPDYVVIAAIEKDYDKEKNTASKMPIFSQRTIERPKPAEKADTSAEALAISLNERGRLDWDRMQQLTGKTPDEMRAELKGILYRNPEGKKWETAEEYLSGRVREKLALARTAAKTDPAYQENVEALEKVQPVDLKPEEIKVTLGAGWIDPQYVSQFLEEELDLPGLKVTYSPEVGTWSIRKPDTYLADRVKNVQAGTPDFYGHELVDLALNGKKPRVTREGELDKAATVAAQGQLEALKDKFKQWLWKDQKRAQDLAHHYNWTSNNLRSAEWDGSHLTLPGSNPAITLRPHQKNVVWRIIRTGNTLLAHEVGAGKTWEMVAGAMELRRLGLAKKPMLVVPNHMLEQFTTEFYQLYPAARVLTIGREELGQAKRKRAMARIASGSWDAVIVAHSSFGKIPVSDETFTKHINEQSKELEIALLEAKANARTAKEEKGDRTIKEIEKAIEKLKVRLEKYLNRENKDDGATFEQLGVDALFVDEAHAFKKLPINTHRTRVAGIPTGTSQRANDMYMKTQYVSQLNGGQRGVVFATGTPVTNTMAELYNMQKYLQPAAMKAANVFNFDAWANQFGEIQTGYELDVSSKGFRENERFTKFINIPELLRMFQQVADVKTADQLKLPRPELVGGAMQPIAGASSPELKLYIDYLVARTEDIRRGLVDVEEDNMLKVVSEGKKAALDIRLVLPGAPDYADSKVNRAVDNIVRIYKETGKDLSTQVVFCDLSVPLSAKRKPSKKKDAEAPAEAEGESSEEEGREAIPEAAGEATFSVYDDMKAKLIQHGIPEKQIAFIHDFKSDVAKQNLFDDVNAGRVRVLFGSTEKMGVGTNVQRRMIALHHMDTPWRPGDVTQRNGRIQRQGNTHKAVSIYQYLTEGSFDAYSWQLIENKARFIQAIMTGDLSLREMEDIGMMIMGADEFKAIASGDPLVKEKIMTDGQLGKLEAQRNAFQAKRRTAQWEYASLPGKIEQSKQEIADFERDIQTIKDTEGWQIGNRKFAADQREEAGKAIQAALEPLRGPIEGFIPIGSYRGLSLSAFQPSFKFSDGKQVTIAPDRFPELRWKGTGQGIHVDLSTHAEKPLSTIQSGEAYARRYLDKNALNSYRDELAEHEKKLAELAPVVQAPWPMESKYQELARRKAELDAHFAPKEGENAATAPAAEEAPKPAESGVRQQLAAYLAMQRYRGTAAPQPESGARQQLREYRERQAAKQNAHVDTNVDTPAKPVESDYDRIIREQSEQQEARRQQNQALRDSRKPKKESKAEAAPAEPTEALTIKEQVLLGLLKRPQDTFSMGEHITVLDEGDAVPGEGNRALASLQARGLVERSGDTFQRTEQGALALRRLKQRGSINLGEVQSLFTGRKDGEPERVYSGLGAAKSNFVRNLSQLEEASPEAHRAAVQAATARAQTAVLMRKAMPQVVKALGGAISRDEFLATLIESRLQGLEQRWRDLVDEAQHVPKDELVDWVLHGPLQLLAAMSEDGELAQSAAALAQNLDVLPPQKTHRNAHDRLRTLVTGALEEAGDSVHHMMPQSEFDRFTRDPHFQSALSVYQKEIEPVLAESHASNEGVFSTALGPLDTYYPLIPVRTEDQARAAIGARKPFKKPANLSNQFATGLSEGYATGLEELTEKVRAAFQTNSKAALLTALEDAGILHTLKRGESAESVKFQGREFAAHIVETKPARTIIEHGKVIPVDATRAAIPEPFYHELKPILEPNAKLPQGLAARLLNLATQLTLSGPADAVYHAHNLLGALVGNTPFLGDDLLTKTIGNTPFTKTFTAIVKMALSDPMGDEATGDLQEMARLGLLPERFGRETYSAKYAEETGAELKRPWKLQFGPTLYGPKGMDVRARLVMYRAGKIINPNATSQEMYHFVNQLGNYTESLQGHIERALKRTGLSPFYTAGSTMLRNGLDTVLGTGSGAGPGGGAKNRLYQMLSGGLPILVAAWVAVYKWVTGKYPWQDHRAKLLKIPARPEWRRSKLGLALWGHDLKKTGYLNFSVFSPLVGRGARALGLDGAFNTEREGGNLAQMAQAAKRDMVNSAIHPVAGPAVRAGVVFGTGKQPYLIHDRQGGSTLLPAVDKHAPIGSEVWSAVKELNSFYGNVGAASGLMTSEDPKATWDEHLLKMLFAFTGAVSGASNPDAAAKSLAQERKAHQAKRR